ncbi:glycosyltransferase family 4 protein [Limnoraphis robusta]|uniref:glycosyltransferase family 4 protein n=1 Tax=Limnoraphis robusta TaxID=1118279 RepID=UPI002B1F736C|nr:glycosyltransferase family 4 protein [Limnoraphis robusta]MEA5496051.1 glycosyltransferase family 4 protein [Limnoraphis robusta BA-68 BA1]
MHLIALESQPSSTLGGQELNLLEICQSLTSRGHEISLVYTEEGDLLESYGKFCKNLIPVKRYQLYHKNPADILQFTLDLFRDVLKISTGSDPVIFSNDFRSVFWGYSLSVFKIIPLVSYLQLPGTPFKLKWRPGLSGVHQFIAVSQVTKDRWVKFCGVDSDKIDVVYNGIDPEKFSPGNDIISRCNHFNILGSKRVFSFLGRLNPNKGIEVLIQAFALVANRRTDVSLLIAGNPALEPTEDSPEARIAYRQSLEKMVHDLGIGEVVQFLGHVPNTPDLYRASDVTVVPSIWPDPCPRVVLEALSSGTPVVGSRVGGIPEMMTGELSQYLVEPSCPEQLAEVLLSVADWRDFDPELGRRCRQYVVDRFSPQTMIDGIESILLKTIREYYQH